jgi:hypothetical protein
VATFCIYIFCFFVSVISVTSIKLFSFICWMFIYFIQNLNEREKTTENYEKQVK